MVGKAPIVWIALAAALGGCTIEDLMQPGGAASPPVQALPAVERPAFPGYAAFDAAAAEALKADPEFQRIDLDAREDARLRRERDLPALCAGAAGTDCASASTLAVQNVHLAHAARLPDGSPVTGHGQLIAVVDQGFRTGHRELAGKRIIEYLGITPRLGVGDHGTAVAALAAGARDGNGILGVAPDAALHLTAWRNVSRDDFLLHLRDATYDAALHGAVVQSNSWGWTTERTLTQELADFRSSGKAGYAGFAPDTYGGTQAQWTSLFAAYDAFQTRGVIVSANSNDRTLPDASAWAALPLLVPELAGAWIVAGNALIEVDGQGRILDAHMLSAPCGSAAAFCLVTDGTVRAPSGTAETGYGVMTGTSFAAPQISGHIALLAQAFPNLAPSELATRLLATAQNGWPSFEASLSGETAFAPGVTRPHSSLYGMGVPDIAAALRPVGGLAIPTGATVADAATPAGGGLDAAAPVIGTAIADALAERRMLLVDALGTDFVRTGAEIGLGGSANAAPSPAASPARQIAAQAPAFALGLRAQAQDPAAAADTATARLFFSQSLAGAAGSRFAATFRLDGTRLMHLAGYVSEDRAAPALGVSLSRLAERPGFSTEVTLAAGHHRDSLFASPVSGPFLGAGSTTAVTASFSATARLGHGWTLTGFAEAGVGAIAERAGSLASFGPVLHAGAGLAATRHGLVAAGDRLSLYAGLRPRAVTGTARLRIPVSRDTEGRIGYETLSVDLAASRSIPARAGLAYLAELRGGLGLSLNLNLDFDAAGTDPAAGSASLALRRRF